MAGQKRQPIDLLLVKGKSWSRSASINFDIADGVKGSLGLSTSASGSITVGSYIPADPTKYSKLGASADFYDYYLKCVKTDLDDAKIYSTTYGDVYFPTGDIYFDVYYQ